MSPPHTPPPTNLTYKGFHLQPDVPWDSPTPLHPMSFPPILWLLAKLFWICFDFIKVRGRRNAYFILLYQCRPVRLPAWHLHVRFSIICCVLVGVTAKGLYLTCRFYYPFVSWVTSAYVYLTWTLEASIYWTPCLYHHGLMVIIQACIIFTKYIVLPIIWISPWNWPSYMDGRYLYVTSYSTNMNSKNIKLVISYTLKTTK
jgi:hypothetical protein